MFKPIHKENLMNKSFPILSIFAAIALFTIAYGALVVQAQSASEAAPNVATYKAVLGKSLNDQDVADFIASNHCSSAGLFQACNAAGLALWTGQDQKVQTVYLYPNKTGEFSAYRGNLPFGLTSNDTMGSVEQKYGQFKEVHAPPAGWVPGLPDEGGSPDHVHYWATYKRFGITIVYNTPSTTDKGASIYAVLVNK
jgi:hypothetical protein